MDDAQPLAEPADLGRFLGETIPDTDTRALLLLDLASGQVRTYLGHPVIEVTETVELDPLPGACVLLPAAPVTAVHEVATAGPAGWLARDPADYAVSKATGMIRGRSTGRIDLGYRGQWPTDPGSWRVTYSHGYPTVPSTVLGVVLAVAARLWVTPQGVDSERVGDYQVKYTAAGGVFTTVEQAALDRYRLLGVA